VTLIPASGGLYITATGREDGVPPMPYAGTVADARTYVDGVTIQTSVLPRAGEIDTTGMEQLDIASQQGIVLVAADLTQVDAAVGAWELATVWRVDSIGPFVPRRFFAPYAHIFDTVSGERIQIVDGAVVPGPMWRVGDVHVHRMAFTVDPSVDFRLEVGQFDGVTAANVIFVLADGAQVVNIPLGEP
jgi:hypothetical protein